MQSSLDEATDPWGVKVERVEIKDVRLPVQLQRAMAAEAEAAREARAKVIAAEGEMRASRALKEASDVISMSPAALQVIFVIRLEQNYYYHSDLEDMISRCVPANVVVRRTDFSSTVCLLFRRNFCTCTSQTKNIPSKAIYFTLHIAIVPRGSLVFELRPLCTLTLSEKHSGRASTRIQGEGRASRVPAAAAAACPAQQCLADRVHLVFKDLPVFGYIINAVSTTGSCSSSYAQYV
ncbi:unnamed protein product [Trichogramma brassicae]|uniref:Band 7 domain-containing protein n=1 Tax=Trichogramma brassicae TaxID=86971 RepID=A0A6H5IGW0_9HYME|nr:unnamed protein product [Trichogramma brassicae]